MKAILSRLFNHEELTRKEAKNLLLNITRGMYNDAQIAALLTVFQMRGIKVEELIGFREALLTTRIPIDFSAYTPIDIVGTGGDGKNTFNISTCACFIVAGIIRKSKFPQNPKRSVRFSGKRTKRSVQKRKARNTQKAETKVL